MFSLSFHNHPYKIFHTAIKANAILYTVKSLLGTCYSHKCFLETIDPSFKVFTKVIKSY